MPFLNWRARSLKQEILPHAALQNELRLTLDSTGVGELISALEDTFIRGQGELRVDLPRKWIVFFKLRDTDSRLLLSHPATDEWVATAALEPGHAAGFLAGLKGLGAGQVAKIVESTAGVSGFSNVEIAIALQ